MPTLANCCPVTKSGFSESFSKRAYANAFNAPNSRYISFPCPPGGGMITLNVGVVVPVGTQPAAKSTLPKVYPDPPSETVTVSTFESLLTTIVALPP